MQGIEGVTLQLAKLGLDAAVVEHRAIATNIANHDSAGFAPSRLDFARLFEAARSGTALQELRPEEFLVRSAPGAAAAIELDMEVARLSENGLQYQALVKAIGKQMALLSMAASDGRR